MSLTCEIPEWGMPVFLGAAVLAIFLTIDVMQRTGHDEINRRDPQWIQWLRRFGFVTMASNLGSAMYFAWSLQITWFGVFFFLVFLSGIYSLFINDLALRLRHSMPSGGTRGSIGRFAPEFIAVSLRKIQEDLEKLDRGQMGMDRGQLLTHEFLQAILIHLQLETDKAAVEPNVVFPKAWRRSTT